MKYKDYNDYLLSDKWQKVKDDFNEFSNKAGDVCFLCYSKGSLQLHHWRYPKNWNNDSYKNLIPLCKNCHKVSHSIEHNKALHNSHMFDTNSDADLIRYLSFIIKATFAMESAFVEMLANEFNNTDMRNQLPEDRK